MVAKELYEEGIKRMQTFDVRNVMPALGMCNSGAQDDVFNTNGCGYYQWTPGIIDLLKPKQIVELGGAMGVWSILALHALPTTSKLYSVTLPEGGLEFSFMMHKPDNFLPVIGDDLNTDIWPEDTNLFDTNLWFFDSAHTYDQLTKELDLYETWFDDDHKDSKLVLLFDDIHLNDDMEKVWKEIKEHRWGIFDCYDATDPLHFSGFGIATV